jgi:glycosyltransferase involved in cell wall biosynthesis
VVHLHAERGNFYFALAALSAGAAVVRTVHGIFHFRGLLRVERTVQRLILRRMGAVHVCVGHGAADNERLRFRNPAEVIENWYDPAFTPPTPRQRFEARAALGLGDGDLVLVSVGNCAPVKRHEAILEATAHPAGPLNLVYLHVGEEDAMRGERRLAARLGIADRARFLGRRHPLVALHAADVFVMPSAHEGLGLAAVEALATGLPAVLADVPGLRDVAGASPAAVLTDVAPEQLATAISRAALPPLGKRTGPEDIRALQDRFGMERGVARLAEIYRRLANAMERQ